MPCLVSASWNRISIVISGDVLEFLYWSICVSPYFLFSRLYPHLRRNLSGNTFVPLLMTRTAKCRWLVRYLGLAQR